MRHALLQALMEAQKEQEKRYETLEAKNTALEKIVSQIGHEQRDMRKSLGHEPPAAPIPLPEPTPVIPAAPVAPATLGPEVKAELGELKSRIQAQEEALGVVRTQMDKMQVTKMEEQPKTTKKEEEPKAKEVPASDSDIATPWPNLCALNPNRVSNTTLTLSLSLHESHTRQP